MSLKALTHIDGNILASARQAATKIKSQKLSREKMLTLCTRLLLDASPSQALDDFWSKIQKLNKDDKYYWIGTLYTLLLPTKLRRSQAAFFTPPHLARGLLELVQRQGFDLQRHTAVDPAAGGASFLSTIAGAMLKADVSAGDILKRLHGYEIDSNLARLSEALVADCISSSVRNSQLVDVTNSLLLKPKQKYDLVIANPPYGRISAADLPNNQWERVCHPGHLNKYALFTELCFRLVKPNGLIALVLPSSFVAGPLYGRLRAYIRKNAEVLMVSSVSRRADIFVDVAQDISILLVKVGQAHKLDKSVAFGTYATRFVFDSSSVLPSNLEGAWISKAESSSLEFGGATLADYGAVIRSGYFVWNREKERMAKTRRAKSCDVPLVWAKNISASGFCHPAGKKGAGIDFVRFEEDSSAIIRTQALVMQRTTNSAQHRRLIVSRISPATLEEFGGFVSENHTITIVGPNVRALNELRFLLNSEAVDVRYRQLSGTASVSVNLLREMDLPQPQCLSDAIERFGYTEKAVQHAYTSSMSQRKAVV